jgi:membrane associated rhomboid family serine protease
MITAMNGYDTYDEHQPVTWIRGRAVYAAHLVVLVFIASMLVTTGFLFAKAYNLLNFLAFDSAAVLRGEVWRLLTSGLVNPPSIWFAIDMLMIAWFGRELEKIFGHKKFLWFYGALYLLKPVLFTFIGLWAPSEFAGQSGGFALFVAFATLYPNAMLMFNLLAKWVALILVALYTLIHLSNRDTIGLISLLATSGFAHLYVRVQQGRLTFPRLRLPGRRPTFQVLPGGAPATKGAPAKNPGPARSIRETATSEMDGLLDKIARSGMGSLTADERIRLDAAAKAHAQRKLGR